MIIIFEGADRTGKTTLAKELEKQTKLPRFQPPRYPHHLDSNIAEMFYKGVNESVLEICTLFDNFILDRFFISDFVYSKFYRREMNLRPLQVSEGISAKVLVVVTEATFDSQCERGNGEEQNEADEEIKKSLFRLYVDLYQKDFGKNFRFLRLNTSKMDEKECMARIKIAMKELNSLKV